jgi:hypothetical protein
MKLHDIKVNMNNGFITIDDKQLEGIEDITINLNSENCKGRRGKINIKMDADVQLEGKIMFDEDIKRFEEYQEIKDKELIIEYKTSEGTNTIKLKTDEKLSPHVYKGLVNFGDVAAISEDKFISYRYE